MDDAMATIRDLTYYDTERDEDRPVLELLAEYLQKTADEVTECGTSGAATLKITVKSMNEGGKATLAILPDVNRTPPKPKLTGLIRFNHGGRLSREDRRQPRLPLKAVETSEGETRDVAVGEPAARRV